MYRRTLLHINDTRSISIQAIRQYPTFVSSHQEILPLISVTTLLDNLRAVASSTATSFLPDKDTQITTMSRKTDKKGLAIDDSSSSDASFDQPSRRRGRDFGSVAAIVRTGSGDLSYDLSSTEIDGEKDPDDDLDYGDDEYEGQKEIQVVVPDDIEPLPDMKRVPKDVDAYLTFNEDRNDLTGLLKDLTVKESNQDDVGDIKNKIGSPASSQSDLQRFDVCDDDEGYAGGSPTLKSIAEWISKKCKNVVVLSGAGVSCSAGIPDFRTPGTGLYDNLAKYDLPYPEAVFDLSFYQVNPKPFVSLSSEIWPGQKYSPTLSHTFIKLLQEKNLLLRNYTQNIDGLEVLAGVDESKLVECHGHFRTASCINCGIPFNGSECKNIMLEKKIAPTCPKCSGLIKPDIVFFGESLPVRFGKLLHHDLNSADLLIVMGTSLQVTPVSLIPEMVASNCPRLLMNRELVGDFVPTGVDGNYRDVFEEGDCDDSVIKLCKLLGWEDELMEMNSSTTI